jgi:uncharacterized protein YmfQ (DUF2313 family)
VAYSLYPVPDMTGVYQNDVFIDSTNLDLYDTSAIYQLDQFFPSTSDHDSTAAWLTFTDSTTQSNCLRTISNFKAREGWMNSNYFIGLCKIYGLTATITAGYSNLFLVGITSVPNEVYDLTGIWVWTITTTGTIDTTIKQILQQKIYSQSPAWTQVIFAGTLA